MLTWQLKTTGCFSWAVHLAWGESFAVGEYLPATASSPLAA